MSTGDAIVRTVEVALDRQRAFEVFSDIGAWWHSSNHTWVDPTRAVEMTLEPRVGGRWLEIWDAHSGDAFVFGRVIAWEPPARIVLTYEAPPYACEPPTELDIRSDQVGGKTRVTLRHSGLDRLTTHARHTLGDHTWRPLVTWFADHASHRARSEQGNTG